MMLGVDYIIALFRWLFDYADKKYALPKYLLGHAYGVRYEADI